MHEIENDQFLDDDLYILSSIQREVKKKIKENTKQIRSSRGKLVLYHTFFPLCWVINQLVVLLYLFGIIWFYEYCLAALAIGRMVDYTAC